MFYDLKIVKISAFLLSTVLTAAAQKEPVVLKSPNGALEISIATVRDELVQAAGGQLAYRVSFHGQPVLLWSNLGLQLEGAPALGPAVRIESSQPSSHDDTWTPVAGKNNPIRDHYDAVTVETVETASNPRRLVIEARAYDDGVAFRYVVPEQPSVEKLRMLNESTQFHFSKDATTFALISRGFQTANEDDYHELTISGLHPEYLVNLPLLLDVPGIAWVGLTEADLENYPNLFVTASGDRTLAARLATRVEDVNTSAAVAPPFDPNTDASQVSVIAQAPVRSGWRVLMIADQPGRLVESNIVVNLNPPSAIGDTSWIKPGKTAWDWWSGSQAKGVAKPGMNNETMKYYIDFAARNKFEYMLIDAGWSARLPTPAGQTGYSRRGRSDLTKSIPAMDIPMLVAYARSKGVRLWLWAHFRDMSEQMADAFGQYEKWGIAGVKIDFMDRTDQWMVNWYRTAAKNAAAHHLMVDFHGAFKPDGMRRTYPNVLTREGVMGAEYNKWSARETPTHNVTLAFTRMLAGPMDYTPGGFDNVTREEFVPRNLLPMVMGTRAHQIALYVVFESELQMVADSPDAYDGQKETAFLRAVPANWDETRVLNGVPPEYITVARRHGTEWFVGSITNWDARELDVPLSFLGRGAYDAEVYVDGLDAALHPKDTVFERRRVSAQTVLKLKLAPGGGSAIRLVPALLH
ncbi:MAG TPA: glycoside hydrolase family 97 protein [Bryobacteraceae bacterium]|nr:glycoside hydrolase family 97 protein [Bryobacteraceae bacterium]